MSRLSAVAALFLGAAPMAAQVTVSGVVREDGTRRPLIGAQVLIEGTRREDTTDAAGRYSLDAATGNRVMLFRMIGYRPVRIRLTVAKGDTVTADVEMVREGAQQLEPIETTARPSGPRGIGVEAFEERRRLGFGKFIDSTDLRRWEGRRMTDVLRGIPGLRLEKYTDDPRRPWIIEWRAAGRGVGSADGTPCWMSVVVDGAPIYRSGSRTPPPDFHREFVQVSSLQAIEVYRSAAEVPMELGGPSEQCGLLVLWTRRPG